MTDAAAAAAARHSAKRRRHMRIPPINRHHALVVLLLARVCSGFTETVPTKWSASHARSGRHSNPNAQTAVSRTPTIISPRQIQPLLPHLLSFVTYPTQLHASAVAADVVELKYTEYTKPEASSAASSKPPVIIVHGLLGQSRNFASIAQSLAAQLQFKRRIITVDLRNHGESGHSDSMSYTAQAQDLLAVMDREGMEEAVLIGHSMGGKVVKAAALLHPERVTGLVVMDIARELHVHDRMFAPCRLEEKTHRIVVIDIRSHHTNLISSHLISSRISILSHTDIPNLPYPAVKYENHEPHWGSVKETIESIVSVDLESCSSKRDVDLALRSSIADPALRAFVLTNLNECRDTGRLSWKINIQSIAAHLNEIAGFEICNPDGTSIKTTGGGLVYNGDVLFIKGGASKFVQNSHLETIQSYFPNYLLTSIRSAGHWLHAEAPEDTIAMLKRYLDR